MDRLDPMQLRLLRLVAGLTLDELGQRIGISGAHLWRCERGYTRMSPDRERRWVAALVHVRLPVTPLSREDGGPSGSGLAS